jgi:hypothetical protein
VADDFSVRGADEFLKLSKALKHAGNGPLRKELTASIKRTAKPLIADTRAEALRRLPQRGGLAKQVAREPQRIQVRTGAKTAGVRVVVGKRQGGARGANAGRLRHPVFGNRDVWVNQSVPPGWFDKPLKAGAPKVRRGLEQTLEEIAQKVIRDAGG